MDTELPPQESEGNVTEWKFLHVVFITVHRPGQCECVTATVCVWMNIHALFSAFLFRPLPGPQPAPGDVAHRR